MGELTRIRDDLERKYRVGGRATTDVVGLPTSSEVEPEVDPAILREVAGATSTFVVETPDSTILTGPATTRELAFANSEFLYLKGRFVEADRPNRNKALWTTQDLEMGQPTVAGGPINWLHNETKVIGAVLDSDLVLVPEQASTTDVGNHLTATAAVWKFLYPLEAQIIERAAADNMLWYSMECVSQTVTCIDAPGQPGCGETFSYGDVQRQQANVCGHLRERSSIRRFGDPTFCGGAIIVPPVKPAWNSADVQVMRQAAELTEKSHLDDALTTKEAESMVAQVIEWANRRSSTNQT